MNHCEVVYEPYAGKHRRLPEALMLASYPGGDPDGITPRLERALRGRVEESEIEDFFGLVSKLGPHGVPARKIENGYRYRDIDVVIEEGVVKQVRPAAQ